MVGSPRGRSMRRILRLLVTAAALVAAVQALAQDEAARRYPNRAVKIIVSAPPGGGLDIAARVIADRLTKMSGQPLVVANPPHPRPHLAPPPAPHPDRAPARPGSPTTPRPPRAARGRGRCGRLRASAPRPRRRPRRPGRRPPATAPAPPAPARASRRRPSGATPPRPCRPPAGGWCRW